MPLSKQAFTRLSEASLEMKRSGGRRIHSQAIPGAAATDAALDRTFSEVSTSSIESSQSVKSTASAAGSWSPRTANAVRKGSKAARAPRTRAFEALGTASPISREGSTASLDLLPDSPEQGTTSQYIAAKRPQPQNFYPNLASEHSLNSVNVQTSSISGPRRTGSITLATQHSILDPLPEQPSDTVRRRKVFGSTFSVGKLGGEIPYTPLLRARGSLTQPPWVAAAARQASSDAQRQHTGVLSSHASLSKQTTATEQLPHTAEASADEHTAPVSANAPATTLIAEDSGKQKCCQFC